MSDADHDRELRDLLEQAQSELKRARTRLEQLQGIENDRDVLRHELAAAQGDLKAATERLAELEDQSTEELQRQLDEVSSDRDLLRQRLEQADKTRESWDGKLAQREAELAVARAEEWRLREELARSDKPIPSKPKRTPQQVVALFAAVSTAALVAVLALLALLFL